MKTGNKDIGPGEKGMIHSDRSDGRGLRRGLNRAPRGKEFSHSYETSL